MAMQKLALAALLAFSIYPLEAKANIKNNCFQKWKTEYDMVEFCIGQQTEALARLRRIPNSGIKSRCSSKWGQEYDMVVFCIEQQSGAASRLRVTEERTSGQSKPARRASSPSSSQGGCSNYIISGGKKICI